MLFFPVDGGLSCSFICSVCLGLLQESLHVLSLQEVENSQDMEYPDASLDDRLSWVLT